MAGIEVYTQQIGVTAQRAPAFSAPAIRGTNALGDLSRTILTSQEDRFKDEAQAAALRDAGQASIVKNEAGAFVRAPAPPGGGSVYMEMFDRVTRERQANLTIKEAEVRLNELQAEHREDPVQFTELAQQHLDGILDSIRANDPEILPAVETRLVTEFSERQRYVVGVAAQRTAQMMEEGHKDKLGAIRAGIVSLFRVPGADPADVEAKLTAYNAEYVKTVDDMVQLRMINKDSRDAALAELGLTQADGQRELANFAQWRTKARPLAGFEIPQLMAIVHSVQGVDDPNAPEGYRVDDFKSWEPGLRSSLGVAANNLLGEKNAAAAAAQAAADKAAEDERKRAALQAAVAQGTTGDYNFKPIARDALDDTFVNELTQGDPNVNVRAQLLTSRGQEIALRQVSSYGYLPSQVRGFIETQIWAPGGLQTAMKMALDVKNLWHNGTPQGLRLYESLDPKVRAAIDYANRQIRMGEAPKVVEGMVDQLRRGTLPTMQEARDRFKDDKGRDVYEAHRDKLIAEAFRTKPEFVPQRVKSDFDSVIGTNLFLHGADTMAAAKAAARQSTVGWVQNPLFLGGFAPAHVGANKGFTVGDLDRAFRPKGTQFSFAAGSLKLQPLDDDARGGWGRYRIWAVKDGRLVGSMLVDGEKLREVFQQKREAARVQAQRSVVEAKRERDRINALVRQQAAAEVARIQEDQRTGRSDWGGD